MVAEKRDATGFIVSFTILSFQYILSLVVVYCPGLLIIWMCLHEDWKATERLLSPTLLPLSGFVVAFVKQPML